MQNASRERCTIGSSRRLSRLALAARSAIVIAACGEALPSPARIDKLRLIAITTPTPDIADGASVELRAIWHDAHSPPPRTVFFRWRVCREGSDREPRACLREDPSDDVSTRSSAEGGEAVTLDASRLPRLGGVDTTYVVILLLCPDRPAEWSADARQFECPSERSIAYAEREGIQAFRRIVVRAVPENTNPSIARLRFGEQDVTRDEETVRITRCTVPAEMPCPTTGIRLEATSDSNQPVPGEPPPPRDPGARCQPPEIARETLFTSFYFTQGGIDRPRAVASACDPLGSGSDASLSAAWSAPRTAGPVRLWVVLRDGRGGETARTFIANVE